MHDLLTIVEHLKDVEKLCCVVEIWLSRRISWEKGVILRSEALGMVREGLLGLVLIAFMGKCGILNKER